MRVSSAEFIKNYGEMTDRARAEPLTITRNGRDWLVLLSVEEYARLRSRDRRVIELEKFTPAEIEAIGRSEVASEHAHLDEEIKDWRP